MVRHYVLDSTGASGVTYEPGQISASDSSGASGWPASNWSAGASGSSAGPSGWHAGASSWSRGSAAGASGWDGSTAAGTWGWAGSEAASAFTIASRGAIG